MNIEAIARRAGLAAALFASALVLLAPERMATAQSNIEVIAPDGVIELPVRRGRLVRLERPAAAVFVADPETADVQAHSPSLVYVFGLTAGVTSLYAVDESDRVLLRRDVVVEHDLSRLNESLATLDPGAALEIQSVDGGLILSGSVRTPVQAREAQLLAEGFLGDNETLINRIAVTSPTQVNIKVHVAEVSRTVEKEFGVNWQALLSSGNFTFGLTNGRDFLNDAGQIILGEQSTLSAGFRSNTQSFSVLLDALEGEGLATVLAEPNLTAISGETASFLAGGEFPVPVSSNDGTTQIDFKDFGISLSFTPTVLNDNRISLRVRPEVSDLTENGSITVDGLEIQALQTRRAETTVELASGQSLGIGGLIESDWDSNITKFPGLGDLPILGPLFRSTSFQRNESELVIIVTPTLVEPTQEALLLPQGGLRAPTDIDLIVNGRLKASSVAPGSPLGLPNTGLAGPVGFDLD